MLCLLADVMRLMIIRLSVAPTGVLREDSEIYIGKQADGRVITVFEYAARETVFGDVGTVFCPNCAADGDEQPLSYLPEECRFVHEHVRRDCYQDHRTHEPDHPLLQQTAYRQLNNSTEYSDSEMEYSLPRLRSDNELWYDIGGKLIHDDDLAGSVIEVQHQSGDFYSRLYSRVKLAHRHNHGVYVIFTSSALYRQWFQRRLVKVKGTDATLGSYGRDSVDFGTMIRPDDDISVFQTKPSRTAGA